MIRIYLFTPTTVYERIVSRHPLFGRMSLHRGVSLLRNGGIYRQVRNPGDEQIAAAEVAYVGGHVYEVSDEEAGRLREAGYGEWLALKPTRPGPGAPYGTGAYGEGPYGGEEGEGALPAPGEDVERLRAYGEGPYGDGTYGGTING